MVPTYIHAAQKIPMQTLRSILGGPAGARFLLLLIAFQGSVGFVIPLLLSPFQILAAVRCCWTAAPQHAVQQCCGAHRHRAALQSDAA
jgi:hypothetical protein